MAVELITEDTKEPIGTLPIEIPDGRKSPGRFAMHGYQYAPDGPLLANAKPYDPGQRKFHRVLHWTMIRMEDGTWQVHVPRQHVGWVKLLPRLRPAASAKA